MTVAEFLNRVSATELDEWKVFYELQAEDRKRAEKKTQKDNDDDED